MKILVAGASGLVGSALVPHLRARGHTVATLVRRPPTSPDEHEWDPARHDLPDAALEGVDAVVNLAGAGVADKRWTPEYKQTILTSRVDSTATLARALARSRPTASLVQASAIGYYGNDRGDQILTERSTPGTDFLADVCARWEAAADPARHAGCRVATIRTGLVMSRRGGTFGRLLPLFRLGLAGPLADGAMWWSWITLADQVGAIEFLLDTDIGGPVNLVSPDPRPNRTVTKAVAAAMHRPALLPVPKIALRVALGEFSEDALASQRVLPDILLDAGFPFRHPTLADAAAWFAG